MTAIGFVSGALKVCHWVRFVEEMAAVGFVSLASNFRGYRKPQGIAMEPPIGLPKKAGSSENRLLIIIASCGLSFLSVLRHLQICTTD